jgi:hypothetical protein
MMTKAVCRFNDSWLRFAINSPDHAVRLKLIFINVAVCELKPPIDG